MNPVDGKVIYPCVDHIWVRSVDNEVKTICIKGYTRTFLNMIESFYEVANLKLVEVHTHSVLFPEFFFKDDRRYGCAVVFYEDECWNIQTGPYYLNSKAMKEIVLPFLTFLDEDAGRVDYKTVKEYLGLKDKEEE